MQLNFLIFLPKSTWSWGAFHDWKVRRHICIFLSLFGHKFYRFSYKLGKFDMLGIFWRARESSIWEGDCWAAIVNLFLLLGEIYEESLQEIANELFKEIEFILFERIDKCCELKKSVPCYKNNKNNLKINFIFLWLQSWFHCIDFYIKINHT